MDDTLLLMGEREPRKEASQKSESILAQEFVEPILAEAKEYLKTHGRLDPAPLFLRLESGEQVVIRLMLPRTHEEKQLIFNDLGLSLRQAGHRIREALLVSEVWYVASKEETLDTAPSQHPNRREAIAILGRDNQGTRFTSVLQPFGRDSQNRPIFEPAAVAEYNQSAEAGSHPVGLVDHLFITDPSR